MAALPHQVLKLFPKTCELLESLLPGAVAMAKIGVPWAKSIVKGVMSFAQLLAVWFAKKRYAGRRVGFGKSEVGEIILSAISPGTKLTPHCRFHKSTVRFPAWKDL